VSPLPPPTLPPPVPSDLLIGPPAGWYADPWTGADVRYWDGRSWTGYTLPTVSPAVATDEPEPTLPLAAAVGAVLVTVASLLGSRVLLDALGDFAWPILVYVAISAVAGYGPMVAYCVWASRRWGTGRPGRDLGFRFRWADAGWGPVTWLACIAGQLTVGVAILALDVPVASNTESLDDLRGERGVLVALLITAVVAAPFVEELIFRGVLLRGLRSTLPVGLAVVLQAVLFGAAHVDPARGAGNIGLVMVLSMVGGVLGTSAVLLRRIGPSIVAHAILNGVVMAYVLLIS
jgi:membrane protease YdiL (CAAX protease family)